MKQTILLALTAIALGAQAQVITLDLSQPTTPTTIEYDDKGNWKEVLNTAADFGALEFQIFSFLHNVTPYPSWDGFTISKSTSEELDYNGGSMAKGGLKGEGTPYLVGYYSAYTQPDGAQVVFNDGKPYAPQEVSICQSPLAYNDIVNGSYSGYVFQQGDYFTLTITALDENYTPDNTRQITYYLADYRGAEASWTLNKGWEKVDLTPLGNVYGLAFTMASTDTGTYGMNTSAYFNLDGLTVAPATSTTLPTITEDTQAEWQLYTIAGQYLGTQTATLRTLRQSLSQGIYIARTGNEAVKIVK